MLRIIYAVIASVVWILIADWLIQNTGVSISEDIEFLSIAIVAAGALAGGD